MEQQNAAGVQGYQSESAAPYTGQAQPRPDQSGAPSIGTPILSQQHAQPQGLFPTSVQLQLGSGSAMTNSMFTVMLGPQTVPQPRIYSVQQTENQQYQHYQAQQQGTSNAYVVQGSQQQQGQQVQGLHLSSQQQQGFVLHGVQQHGRQLVLQGSGSNVSLPYVSQGHSQQNQPTLMLQSSQAFPGHHIVLASGSDGQQQLLLVSASGQVSGVQSSLQPSVLQQSSAPSVPTTAIQQQAQQQQQQHQMPALSVTVQPQNAPLTQSTTAQSQPAANPAAAQQQQRGLLLPTLQTQSGLPTMSFAQHQQPAPPPQQQQSQQQQLQQQLMQQLQQLQQQQQQIPPRGPAISDTFASLQGSTGLALETPGRVLVPIRALTQGGAGAGGSSQNPPPASAAAAGACQPAPHPSSPVHNHVKAAATTSPPGSPAVGQSPRAGPRGLAHPVASQGSLDQPSSPVSSRRGDPGGLLGPGPGRSRLSQLEGAEAGSGAGPSGGKPGRVHGASAAPRPRKRVRPAHHLMEAETKYGALTQQLQLLEAEHSMIVSKAQLLELVVQCKESQAAHLQLLHQALPSPAQQLLGPGASLPGTSTSPPPSSSSLPHKASNIEGLSSSSQNPIVLPLTPPTAQQVGIFRARCQAAQLLLADLSQLSQFTIEQLGAAVAQAVFQLRIMQLQPSIDKGEADARAGSNAAVGPTGVGPVACPATRLAISAGTASGSGSDALPARLSEPQLVSPGVVAGASGQSPAAVEGVLGVQGPSLAALLAGPLLPTGVTPDAGGSAAAVVQPPIMPPSQPSTATVGTSLSGFGGIRPGLAALVACLPLVFLCNPVAPALMGRRLVPTVPEPEAGPSAPPPVPAGLPAALQVLSMMQLAPAQLQLLADLQAWLQTCLLKQEVLHHHWAGCLRRLMRLENSRKAKSFRVQLGGPFLRQAELFEESVKLLCANQLLVALVVEVTCSCILSPIQLEMLVAASWPTFPDFLSLLGAASVLVTGADAEVTPATPVAAEEQPEPHPCPGSSSP